MQQTAISIQNLSKRYKIGEKQDYLTLRDQLSKWSKSIFSFGKNTSKKSEFWALDDVSLEINKGDVVGIVGRNGAGKSTLLKIISRITPPTRGRIELNGRVASLLEVGTGFSPELTGRENIFLNGSILGMSRKEIKTKFNDIVEFSEIGEFLDTQVKHYSSGMYVRLAFAVAAHLDPDILIVDEVLAVGDAEFQKKCLNKISDISEGEGRTVLFVSHNMASVVRLCNKAVLLENGKVKDVGKPSLIVEKYLRESKKNKAQYVFRNTDESVPAQILGASILNKEGKARRTVILEEGFKLRIDYQIKKEVQAGAIVITVKHQDDIVFISTDCDLDGKLKKYNKGVYSCFVDFPEHLLNSGQYTLTLAISKPGINFYSKKQDIMIEVMSNNAFRNAVFNDQVPGVVSPILRYTNEKLMK